MAISVTFSLDEATVKKLRDISQYGKNSEKIRELISREWDRVFQDGVHPQPITAEAIPVESQP